MYYLSDIIAISSVQKLDKQLKMWTVIKFQSVYIETDVFISIGNCLTPILFDGIPGIIATYVSVIFSTRYLYTILERLRCHYRGIKK